MRRRSWLSVAVWGCLITQAGAAWAEAPATQPTLSPTTAPAAAPAAVASMTPAVKTDQPLLKTDRDGKPNGRFLALHAEFLDRAWQAPVDLLFLGDSITEGWRNAPEIWKSHYWQYAPADFGIGGDRTEHVLWRIAHGELDRVHPKVLVLMIGTNNIGSPAEQITAGDLAIVQQIHRKLPDTKLLLLAIFPRGKEPTNAMRDKIKQVNAELAKLDDGSQTRYLDIGPKFLDPAGVIQPEVMKDFLHPTVKGYQIWADAMQPLLDEMMK